MFKVIGFIPRRPDITRAAFRHYYESQHVLLALRHIRAFSKYVRNHVVSGVPGEPAFDCLPEWWFDGPQVAADIAAWVATPAGDVLHHDEANFMDRPRMASCPVREQLLFGPARPYERWMQRKLGLMFTPAGSAPADLEAELARYGEELLRRNAGAVTRVGLDVPLDPSQASVPLNAVFWLWPTTPETPIALPPPSAALGRLSEITFDAIETPIAALRD